MDIVINMVLIFRLAAFFEGPPVIPPSIFYEKCTNTLSNLVSFN